MLSEESKGEKYNAVNHKNQKGEKCNARRIKRGEVQCNQLEESKGGKVQSIKKNQKGKKKPNCKHTTQQTTKCENSIH